MYRYRYREEEFAYIVALPDGRIDFYNKRAATAIKDRELDRLAQYRLGEPEHLISNKKTRRILANQLAGIPRRIYELPCPLKSPIVVQLELTLRCNFKCKHCFDYAGQARANELSFNEIEGILRQLKELEVMSVFFTGGEPLLRSDFANVIWCAHELDLDYFILTNGTLITPNLLSRLPRPSYFVISLDGVDSHKKLRGGFDVKEMERCFDLLRENNFPFTAQYVAQRENLEDLVRTYEWCAEKGVDLAAIDLYVTGRVKENHHIIPTEDDLPRFAKLAEAKFKYEQIQKSWKCLQTDSNIPNPYQFTFIARLEEMFERSFSGVFFAYITSDGKVYPDNWHGGEGLFCAGSLREHSLEHLWLHCFTDIRNLGRWSSFKKCKTCPVAAYFCDYRLPVLSKNLYGDYTTCGATETMRKVMLMRAIMREQTESVLSNDEARAIDIW